MNSDTVFGLFVYAANYHSGQGSRLYRLLSTITRRYQPKLTDCAWNGVAKGIGPAREEWTEAREVYRRAKRARMGQ
jgi:hypothetical protein